jgi:hypothetical protein
MQVQDWHGFLQLAILKKHMTINKDHEEFEGKAYPQRLQHPESDLVQDNGTDYF